MASKGTTDPGMGLGDAVHKENEIYDSFMLDGADRERSPGGHGQKQSLGLVQKPQGANVSKAVTHGGTQGRAGTSGLCAGKDEQGVI